MTPTKLDPLMKSTVAAYVRLYIIVWKHPVNHSMQLEVKPDLILKLHLTKTMLTWIKAVYFIRGLTEQPEDVTKAFMAVYTKAKLPH